MGKKLARFVAAFVAFAVAVAVAVALPVSASFAEDTASDNDNIISLINWLKSDDCSIELTEAQEDDAEYVLSLYQILLDYESDSYDEKAFDLTDEDDAAALDNILTSLDVIDELIDLISDDENFDGSNYSTYTNLTMLVGSAYTANVSIDKAAHVADARWYFCLNEGLAWNNMSAIYAVTQWYTNEKELFDECRDNLGYDDGDALTSAEIKAIETLAASCGYTIGHYTNLFFSTSQVIGVGTTTEKGELNCKYTVSYNMGYASSYSSYVFSGSTSYTYYSSGATYTTEDIRKIIYTYICEEINEGHTYTSEVTTEATCTTDGV